MARASSSWPDSTTMGTSGECSMTRRKVSAPRLSGRFRSSRTSEGVSRAREANPSDSRLTQLTFTGDLPSISRSRTRSASPGLSSISNTCVAWGSIRPLFSLPRQAGNAEPECLDRFHCQEKLFQISRLVDVTIPTQFVTAKNVLAQPRGAEDHDRNPAEFLACLHGRQYCEAGFLRKVQVQDHQIGPDGVGVLILAVQKSHGFYTVFDAIDLAAMLASGQRFAD